VQEKTDSSKRSKHKFANSTDGDFRKKESDQSIKFNNKTTNPSKFRNTAISPPRSSVSETLKKMANGPSGNKPEIIV
jgi:hypothetical protein